MVVATGRPSRTAVAEHPPPKWQVISRNGGAPSPPAGEAVFTIPAARSAQ